VGVLLAAAGAALQGILLNPLADPYTVGVSSGAALGASIAFVLGFAGWLHGFGIPAMAFAFACAAMLIVYWLARTAGRVSIHSFLLAGVVVGSFLWAALTFVLTIAGQDLAMVIHWLLGSFADAPWSYVVMVLPFAVIGLGMLFAMARDLNIYSLGEETARHLGIETEPLKLVVIATASLITAAAVSVSGIIGFVGLIIPHLARRVFGADHRVLLPTAALSGAILMVLADTAARSLGELPVGVITAMIGAPFFLYLLRRQNTMKR
jgi:iron complex transport system permease protein